MDSNGISLIQLNWSKSESQLGDISESTWIFHPFKHIPTHVQIQGTMKDLGPMLMKVSKTSTHLSSSQSSQMRCELTVEEPWQNLCGGSETLMPQVGLLVTL